MTTMQQVRSALAAGLLAALGVSAGATSYTLDPTHTAALFEVRHDGLSTVQGRFSRPRGSVAFDRAARTGRVDIEIETASVSTGVAAFDQRLQGKEFLDSAAFPRARFVGERFTFDGDNVTAVSGTLTLRGQSHPLTLEARRFNCYTSPLFRREVCGGDFEATLQRSQWGMDGGLPDLAPDAVRLLIQVEAIRQ